MHDDLLVHRDGDATVKVDNELRCVEKGKDDVDCVREWGGGEGGASACMSARQYLRACVSVCLAFAAARAMRPTRREKRWQDTS